VPRLLTEGSLSVPVIFVGFAKLSDYGLGQLLGLVNDTTNLVSYFGQIFGVGEWRRFRQPQHLERGIESVNNSVSHIILRHYYSLYNLQLLGELQDLCLGVEYLAGLGNSPGRRSGLCHITRYSLSAGD
jgi:hypothetical protein